MLRPTAVRTSRFGQQTSFDHRLLYLLLHPSEEMIAITASAIADDKPTIDVIKAVVEVAIAQSEAQ